jgi:glycosyltransferase involved in cell wall biosynthesis
MRISIDSNIFTMQRYGGVSRYLVLLSEELKNLGNEVEIHGWLHTNRYLRDSPAGLTQMRYIERFPRFTRRLAHHAGDLLANKRLAQDPPDLIHESFYHNRRVGPPDTPSVCTVHDMIHELYPQLWGSMDRTPEYRKASIDRCNAVICVSENTKKDLLRLCDVDPNKIHVVHHGFEHMPPASPLSLADESAFDSLKTQPFLLYVGSRSAYKNFNGFLQGLAQSGLSRELAVIAFGGKPFTQTERHLMESLGLVTAKIRQLSGSDALLRALYRKAEAFVYPSLYEGFGFPPLEAMAEGCPVIASNTSSMPEVIGDAAEYFDPLDSDSIAKALVAVIGNLPHRCKLVTLGYQRLKKFSWAECARRTLDVYHSVI